MEQYRHSYLLIYIGGAFKFESDIFREMNMRLNKFDEISSLVRGVEFMVETDLK